MHMDIIEQNEILNKWINQECYLYKDYILSF